MKTISLSELSKKLGLELRGEDAIIKGLNTLEAAGPDEISFLANPKYAHFLPSTNACAVIVDEAHAGHVKRALVSANPYIDFGRALSLFVRKEGEFDGISPLASVSDSAVLGENCTIYPFAYIGPRVQLGKNCIVFPGVYIGEDAKLGDNCTLYPNSVILSRVETGNGCVLHPGAVIGAEGFGFVRAEGGIQRIPQAGFVTLSDNVEIGVNSAIDRGALGPTIIGSDTKLDNLVQIGHNVVVGKQNLIISQVGISGSTHTGDRVTMAGQAGVSGHLKIGDDVILGPQAGVAKDVLKGVTGSGSPLMESQTYLRVSATIPKLPDMYKRLNRLEKDLAKLKDEIENNERFSKE